MQKLIQSNLRLKDQISMLNENISDYKLTRKNTPEMEVPQENQQLKAEVLKQNSTIARLKNKQKQAVSVSQTKELQNQLSFLRKREQQLQIEKQTLMGIRKLKDEAIFQQLRTLGTDSSLKHLKEDIKNAAYQNSNIKAHYLNFFKDFMRGSPQIEQQKSPHEQTLMKNYQLKCANLRTEINQIEKKWVSIIKSQERKLTELRERQIANQDQIQELIKQRKKESREIAFKQKINKKIQDFYNKKQVTLKESNKPPKHQPEDQQHRSKAKSQKSPKAKPKFQELYAARRKWLMPQQS